MPIFKPLNTRIYKKPNKVVTPDVIYWKKLGDPVLVKEFGPIDYIDFSPLEPHHFAVTCSVRVQVYNPITKLVVKNLSRFRENAYGATFRNDGKLLCSGSAESVVKLFDVSSKSLLRLFKGHTAEVHRTFFVEDRPQIISYSDDKSVKVWDISTEKEIVTYSEHTDYVRAGAVNPIMPDITISGGYDGVVKMYDARVGASILTAQHDAPVESVLFLPSGGIFLSCGGTDIKIWDMMGAKLLGSVSQHHKTITCMRLASDNKRLLSGSLDRHVKIYDTSNFEVVHTLTYPNSILSLGVSRNDDTVVAGLVDGLVCVSRREEDKEEDEAKKMSSFKYNAKKTTLQPTADLVVSSTEMGIQAKYDRKLKKFQYNKAFETVMASYVINKTPHVTMTVLQELQRRKCLHRVFEQLEHRYMLLLLTFFVRGISDVTFSRPLIPMIHMFMDIWESKLDTLPLEIVKKVIELSHMVTLENDILDQFSVLEGSLQMIVAASRASETPKDPLQKLNLMPSEEAQKKLVLNLT
ncbi:PREDICTED: U3 small nucleolar RNA-associated protein 15 homolog [Nicrophorus vespilloides]|uniref:U3 small nucleolar RNA-associated protein 15 homolog n=1 Tax=Nicrophorus vespilloides TaxID=110193 RepID=A0ABM1MTR4_NICVS|nr:PREDICTED: U3 small nucleolar RNA-associated protein 15 homolog [Nicrophorus vespilloides]